MENNGFQFTTTDTGKNIIVRDTPPHFCLMTIFGATGDLARTKLFPAIYRLAADDRLPEEFTIIGFSHTDRQTDSFRQQIMENVATVIGESFDRQVWDRLASRLQYHSGDFGSLEDYRALARRIDALETSHSQQNNRLFYLATPSSFFPDILRNLDGAKLIHPATMDNRQPWSRLVIEKPFGSDLESARELNRLARQALDESQIYRVDHYMAKETVQNILVFRFANTIFEPVWNRAHVDHVRITGAEEIGIGTRGAFYDKTGVIRDVVQNHMMQILALMAMEAPVSFKAKDFHDEKAKFFRVLRPLKSENISHQVVLGQYRGFRETAGVAPASATPTFCAMQLFVDNWRWQGVPFYIRAGKGLAAKKTEVAVHFRSTPVCLFGSEEVCGKIKPNVLCLRIQPDEGITLSFSCKVPGDHLEIGKVTMDFSYQRGFARQGRTAYERLLLDSMRGDQTLFARSDSIEQQWQFFEPILKADDSSLPVHPYEPGSSGPSAAKALLDGQDNLWGTQG